MTQIPCGKHKIRHLCGLILSIALISVQADHGRVDGAASKPLVEGQPSNSRQNYFGTLIGPLVNRAAHGVSGEVYAVDEQTLFIRNFNYDGRAPDAYFWSNALNTPKPQDGFIVPDEKGSTKPLERYANKDIVLRLPEGKTLREIQWLSIWSRQLKASVADIQIPHSSSSFVIPRPLEISAFSELAHGLKSAPITIVDAQTFLVPEFHYDGLGPDAYFWLTRSTSGLSSQNSLKLRDENGSAAPLRKYQGATLVISLPDEFTIYDFDFFGVWCKKFSANFGQTQIPQMARVPPSPKMLGIKPENKLNCEILHDDLGFEIRWVLDGDDIVLQLVGKIEPGEYMAFGLGKDDSRSDMNNADAVVAWVERQTGQVHAVDYFLGAKQQCKPTPGADPQKPIYTGSCPDVKMPAGSDSLTLLHGAIVNGYSMVTFKRPQLGVDEQFDQHVYSDGQQSVIWAIGSLNEHKEVGYHRLRTQANMFIDFARNPQWNCPIPDLNASMHNNLPIGSASQLDQSIMSANGDSSQLLASSSSQLAGQPSELSPSSSSLGAADSLSSSQLESGSRSQPTSSEPIAAAAAAAWFIPQIVCPNERTFYAQIGPTAGRKGYAGLTGRPINWTPPISWYINGLMIPELVVERGQTYRFIVEGGNDKLNSARRHPLYLTDSAEGGFNFKTDDERQRERIYGGVAQRTTDSQFVPTAEGRLCEWRATNQTLPDPDLYATFSAYQRSLKLECVAGQASVLKFVPDANTPDTIYYQCYTNRLMGWKIRVVDSCSDYLGSLQTAASRIVPSVVLPAPSTSKRHASSNAPKRSSKLSLLKERLERRQSREQPDLKAQQSEQRMLAFDFAPQHFMNNQHQSLQQRQQNGAPPPPIPLADNLVGDDDFLEGSTGGPLDFGDELAASEESPLARQNNSLFASPATNGNLSLYEQILKMAPNDLEILDDSQLDLASALALAAATSQSQQQLGQLPLSIPLQSAQMQQQQQQQAANATSSKGSKLSINKVPKSLHAYMRRLASFYYPVQQQLISMLAPSSGWSQNTPPSSDQQQQATAAALAQLHQQIVAASTAIPASMSSNPAKPGSKSQSSSSGEPIAAASAPSSTFSLASLVPKPKIDLSKSNLSKKFNKFRIKSGRKYEPQTSGSGQNKQLTRPPTPDNEFNYDIFNNQLMQLEQQQRQLQSLEGFAAAASALMANHHNQGPHWQPPPPPQAQLDAFDTNFYAQNFVGSAGSGRSPQQTSATPMSQTQLEQQDALLFSSSSNMFEHQNEPLQQQQSSHNKQQMELAASGQQNPHEQAIFITKLAVQQAANFPFAQPQAIQQQQQQQQSHQPIHIAGTESVQAALSSTPPTSDQQQNWRKPQMIQSYYGQAAQPSRARPSYLDSTDYSQASRPQASLEGAEEAPRQTISQEDRTNAIGQQQQQQSGESLRATESGRQQQVAKATPTEAHFSEQLTLATAAGEPDLDHMLAIERYSKQPSDRRQPSVVDPTTGEQVVFIEEEPQQARQQQQLQQNFQQTRSNQTQPQRYSSMLIDRHVVAPSTSSTPSSLFNSAGRGEVLDSEQSAPDLKRLNASEQGAMFVTVEPQQQQPTESHQKQFLSSTTSEPGQPVLVRPSTPASGATLVDFFASEPPATATTPTSLQSFGGLQPSGSLPFSLQTFGSTAGPLVPSAGPPMERAPTWRAPTQPSGELVFKSNLIEPIKSTLVPGDLLRPSHLDTSPFTPIEVSPTLATHQNYAAASSLQQFRLRPPPLVESMLSQYATPFRPEPPVRVASYLAQQLAGQTSQSISAHAPSSNSVTNNNNNTQLGTRQPMSGSHLIILKPSAVASQQQKAPHTYALKPELVVAAASRSNFGQDLQTLADGQQISSSSGHQQIGDLFHTAASEQASRRLAANQFDRLSSLSSPPSTSMMLSSSQPTSDPMLASNSIQSFSNFQLTNHMGPALRVTLTNSATSSPPSSSVTTTTNASTAKTTHQQLGDDVTRHLEPLGHHLKLAASANNNTATKTSADAQAAKSTSAKQTNQAPSSSQPQQQHHHQQQQQQHNWLDEAAQLPLFEAAGNAQVRDNSTDNAILSHVMSLISANAVPAPPVMPLASYAPADYFLPISSLDAHLAPHRTALLRARSIRS